MQSLITILIALSIGSAILVNGVNLNTKDIVDTTKIVVNQTNLHQLKTALELYYLDYNKYPLANDSAALIDTLTEKGYLEDNTLEANIFNYTALKDGQNYDLEIIG